MWILLFLTSLKIFILVNSYILIKIHVISLFSPYEM